MSIEKTRKFLHCTILAKKFTRTIEIRCVVLRPGFEPGSSARKAEILNLTILSEPKQGINQINILSF